MKRLASTLVFALSCLAACGETTNGGSGGQGTTTTTGGGAGGETSSHSATGGTTGGGTCDGFANAQGSGSVTLRLHNETGVEISVLSSPCGKGALWSAYAITPAAGDDGAVYPGKYACLPTCAELQSHRGACCDCGVPYPPETTLKPGETMDQTWDGTGFRSTQMPKECFGPDDGPCPGNSSGTGCLQLVAAPAGSYVVRATASGAGSSATSDPVTFTYPGTSIVEVVFGPNAFAGADAGP